MVKCKVCKENTISSVGVCVNLKCPSREIEKLIEYVDLSKLEYKNSVLIVRSKNLFGHFDMGILSEHLPANTLICVMEPDQTIETLSQEEMNKAGWYRKSET